MSGKFTIYELLCTNRKTNIYINEPNIKKFSYVHKINVQNNRVLLQVNRTSQVKSLRTPTLYLKKTKKHSSQEPNYKLLFS